MDDTAPKPPVRPAKAARRPVRDAAPQAKGKAAGKVPAIVAAPAASSPIATEAATATVPSIDDVLTGPLVLPAVVAAPAPVPDSAPAPVADATPTPDPIPTPVDARAPAPAPIALTAAKEVIMETIETVTAKTQTAFADATAQAKGAVEKSQKMFEDANEFGKGNIEALVESSKIAVRGLEALGQDAAAYAKTSFEEATAAAKTMTSVKSPTELMKLQSDYARSAFDAMVQQTSRNTEAMLKLAGEVVQPLSNRVALAAEKMKVVA